MVLAVSFVFDFVFWHALGLKQAKDRCSGACGVKGQGGEQNNESRLCTAPEGQSVVMLMEVA